LPHENALFWGLWDEGFNGGSIGTGCSALLPGINRRPNLCPPGSFAKKAGYKVVGVWKEIASGAKQERAERKKVLALAQARKVDVIPRHRTDPLGPLGQVRRAVLNVL